MSKIFMIFNGNMQRFSGGQGSSSFPTHKTSIESFRSFPALIYCLLSFTPLIFSVFLEIIPGPKKLFSSYFRVVLSDIYSDYSSFPNRLLYQLLEFGNFK